MFEIWHCQSKASRTPVDRTLAARRPGKAVARCARRSSTMLRGEVRADAARDPRRGVLDRVPGQVRISGGRLHLRVTEQLPDHGQALAQGQRP